jgi:ABC-2 type transport system ATP-binding protein
MLPLPCSDPVLVVDSVLKRFKKGPIIGPITFSINSGEVFALIGPNGAGKTTTIRMIAGIYRPDAGRVKICGTERRQGLIAFVPEESAVYPRLTGYEHLLFYARLYYSDPRIVRSVVEKAAKISGLGGHLKRKVSEYSKGMKRRLLVALVLALETPLLILDEPTSGLDVYSSVEVRKLIVNAARSGRAVLLTSHNMLEVERIADRVAFISEGKIIDIDQPMNLIEKYGGRDLEEAFVNAVKSWKGREG